MNEENTTPGTQTTGDDDQTTSQPLTPLEQELADTKAKLEEMVKISQIALADLQNFKRRAQEEKSQFVLFANAGIVTELLPIFDNAERAIQHAPQDANLKDWIDGVIATLKQFETTLQEKGLKQINSLNQNFDPNFHEAIVSDFGPKDLVLKEFERGYTYNEKVLRRAKVAVGNGLEKPAENQTQAPPSEAENKTQNDLTSSN